MQLLAAIAPHVGKILDTVQRLVNRSGLKRARQVGSPLNAVPH